MGGLDKTLTLVSTTPQAALGEVRYDYHPTAGMGRRGWVYVFNDDGVTAFAAGDVIMRDPSAATETVWGGIITAATTVISKHFVIGVAQHAIAGGSYGWIQFYGKCLVKIGTENMTADTPFTTGGSRAGSVLIWADGATTSEASFGVSLEADTTDNTTVDAFVNCPGTAGV